jgi:hypothetical protein
MATNAKELLARIAKQKEDTSAIQALWASLFPEFTTVDVRQCQVWLKLYTFDQVADALEIANCKLHRRSNKPDEPVLEPLPYSAPMDREQAVRYASGAMKGLKKAQNG